MRMLWLKTELLHPVDKGGKIRTFHMLKELKKSHHITYLTLDDGTAGRDAEERASEYCHELLRVPHQTAPKLSKAFYKEVVANIFSRLPYAVEKYRSEPFSRRLADQVSSGRVDLIVCDFLFPSINLPAVLRCPTVLFQHNVEAQIWRRHAEVQNNPLSRWYFHEQWRRMRAYERTACARFDAVVAVSPEDREMLRSEYGVTQAFDIPTGVDALYYAPNPLIQSEPLSLVFTGSMDWLPNDDAMWYFVQEILPLVRAVLPDVRLTIVGRNPFPRLQELAQKDPQIVVTGRVDDVRPYINRAAAYIIPLRIGGGTRLKVFEAMAMEKAIVSTSIGVEGLRVTDGEDVLVADSPRAFAQAVLRALLEKDFAQTLARQAGDKVRREFGWQSVAESFSRICQRTVTRADGRLVVAA